MPLIMYSACPCKVPQLVRRAQPGRICGQQLPQGGLGLCFDVAVAACSVRDPSTYRTAGLRRGTAT
jgi:hypothetical protein